MSKFLKALPGLPLGLVLLTTAVSLMGDPAFSLDSRKASQANRSTQIQARSISPQSAEEILNKTSAAFNDIAQNASPAVVSIQVIKAGDSEKEGLPFPFSTEASNHQRTMGIGSGVMIRQDGYILTNYHVVENAEKITVKFDEKHKLPAKVVGTDPKTDLAVIKIEDLGKAYSTISFADSGQVKVGDWAIAIGSPFGLTRSMSKGIVSAVGRAQMGILEIEDFIQTDAAINPGSSGGPLLNMNGEMIGINTAIFSQGAGFVGIGFAIPAEIAKEVSSQLITHGKMNRGWTGVSVQDLDEDLSRYFHAPSTSGALVSQVAPKGPGDQASLHTGDIILRYNQKTIKNAFEFKRASAKSPVGSIAIVEISRNGTIQRMNLKVGSPPSPSELPKIPSTQQAGKLGSRPPSIGLVIEELPAEVAKLLHLTPSSGVLIVGVEPGSPASEAGLSPGDIILRANQTEIHNSKEFTQLVKKFQNEEISMLYVQRGIDEKLFIPIRAKA